MFSLLITPQQIISLYETAVDTLPEGAKVQIEEGLAPIVAYPEATESGLPLYPTFFAKVAALLRSIAYERPFPDGNRKVAWECAKYLLQTRGYTLSASDPEIAQLMAAAETGFISVHRIALWLKGHVERNG